MPVERYHRRHASGIGTLRRMGSTGRLVPHARGHAPGIADAYHVAFCARMTSRGSPLRQPCWTPPHSRRGRLRLTTLKPLEPVCRRERVHFWRLPTRSGGPDRPLSPAELVHRGRSMKLARARLCSSGMRLDSSRPGIPNGTSSSACVSNMRMLCSSWHVELSRRLDDILGDQVES